MCFYVSDIHTLLATCRVHHTLVLPRVMGALSRPLFLHVFRVFQLVACDFLTTRPRSQTNPFVASDCLLLVLAKVSWQLQPSFPLWFACIQSVVLMPFCTTLPNICHCLPSACIAALLLTTSLSYPCKGHVFVLLRQSFVSKVRLAQTLWALPIVVLLTHLVRAFSDHAEQNFTLTHTRHHDTLLSSSCFCCLVTQLC